MTTTTATQTFTVNHQDFTAPGDPYTVTTVEAHDATAALIMVSGITVPTGHDTIKVTSWDGSREHDWWVTA